MSTLIKLQVYMKGRKLLLPLSLFLSSVSSVAGILPYIFVWFIIRLLFSPQDIHANSDIKFYAIAAVVCSVLSVVLYYCSLACSHLAAFRVESNMRKIAMSKVISMPLGFFNKNTSGKIRKLIDDNASITHVFLAHQLPDLAGSVLIPISAFVLVFLFDWRLGLVCIIPMILALVFIASMNGSTGKVFMNNYMSSLEDMNTEAVEYLRGVPVVKVFQQTVYSFKNFNKSIINYKNMVSDYTHLWENPMSLYTVMINSFVFFLVPTAIIIMSYSSEYSSVLVNLFLYVLISPIFSQSIMRSMYLLQAMSQAGEAMGRMENLTSSDSLYVSNAPKKLCRYDIDFSNVFFAYPESNKNAVNGISFSIKSGDTLALVGSSGSGKTSIARLLSRFWDADKGKISIGGVDVKEVDINHLMNNISFVFQNSKLFKTSILDNLRYGNSSASISDINKALDMAQCRDIIDKLPLGIDTIIGSDGTYLSGGEQQRISLARAMLKNAPIVVLDEATAFADPENEHLISMALAELTKNKTVVMIAHRLSSVVNANKILLLKNGEILEEGNHEKLLRMNGLYMQMWQDFNKSVEWTIGEEACND